MEILLRLFVRNMRLIETRLQSEDKGFVDFPQRNTA